MQELNASNEIGLLALFIHPYIFILCSAYSRSRDFVACAIHVWMRSRIYVKKCRQALQINLFPFLILSLPSPPQHLKVENTPRRAIACAVSAAAAACPLLRVSLEGESPASCPPEPPETLPPTEQAHSPQQAAGAAVSPSLRICPTLTCGVPPATFYVKQIESKLYLKATEKNSGCFFCLLQELHLSLKSWFFPLAKSHSPVVLEA